MSGKTTTERVTRFVGQSVQVGDVIVTVAGSNGKQVSFDITAPVETVILVPLDMGYQTQHRKLVQNSKGWWNTVPRNLEERRETHEGDHPPVAGSVGDAGSD